jgi:hypothetical protein
MKNKRDLQNLNPANEGQKSKKKPTATLEPEPGLDGSKSG